MGDRVSHPGMRTGWTEQEIRRLREMAADGHSARSIATGTGRTRNSVIGQCHRMGITLKGADPQAKARTPDTRRHSATDPHAARPPKPRAERRRDAPSAIDQDSTAGALHDHLTRHRVAGTEPVAFRDLQPRTCRYPLQAVMERAGPDTPFCGLPAADDGSWCSHHRGVVYQPRASS